MIPSVNAETETCSSSANLAKPNNFLDGFYAFRDKTFTFVSGLTGSSAVGPVSSTYNGYISVEPNTTYYFSAPDSGASRLIIAFLDSDFNQLTYTSKKMTSISAVSPENASYAILYHYYGTLNGTSYYFSATNEYVDYVETACTVTEEPEEPIIPDTTLDSFYSIYVEKLTLLSNYALENRFVLSAITIILVLVCLELFIYLIKGGRKR